MGRGGVYIRMHGLPECDRRERSCLTCSKAFKTRKWRGPWQYSHNNSFLFCSQRCAGAWKKCESGRKHRCKKCNRKVGWVRGGRIVCSECRASAAPYVQCSCKQCGRAFTKRRTVVQVFCSQQCFKAQIKEKRRTECAKCGVSFIPKNPRAKKYCSRACAGVGEMHSVDRQARQAARVEAARNAVMRTLNARARKDERQWRSERCKCGRLAVGKKLCQICNSQRRATRKRQQNNTYGDFHRSGIREQVIARDGGICQYCGRRPRVPTVDHLLAVSKGGENELGNLVVACKRCNSIKCNKTPLELFNWPKWIKHRDARLVNKCQGTLFR